MKETTDSELMRQVRGGRTAALATLFERHHARLYRYCIRMTGQRSAAEDLVQDTFMKMLKYKATFRDDSEFVPWMFGIGRNACLAHLRRTADDRVPKHEQDYTDFDVASLTDQISDDSSGDARGRPRWRTQRTTTYAVGGGGSDIQFRTFNGDIMIRKR